MSVELIPWLLVALSIALVGAAVLILALDSRIAKSIARGQAEQLNLHAEALHGMIQANDARVRHERAAAQLPAGL